MFELSIFIDNTPVWYRIFWVSMACAWIFHKVNKVRFGLWIINILSQYGERQQMDRAYTVNNLREGRVKSKSLRTVPSLMGEERVFHPGSCSWLGSLYFININIARRQLAQ